MRCAGTSTGLPPSIEVAERGALSGLLVSEMLKRRVEKEDFSGSLLLASEVCTVQAPPQGSILKEDEIHCQSGYVIYLWVRGGTVVWDRRGEKLVGGWGVGIVGGGW